MSLDTRSRPLSFSYQRAADDREGLRLVQARQDFERDPRAELTEIGSAFVIGLASLVFVAPVVFLISWGLATALGTHLASDTVWIVGLALWLALWTGTGVVRVMIGRRKMARAAQALDSDIENSLAQEENWRFLEAVGFQEAETLPILYVLRADDNAVVVLEEDMVRRHVTDRSRGRGHYAPADALLVRGAKSGLLLSEGYSGPSLPLNGLYALRTGPRPEHGSLLDLTWGEVMERFSRH